MSEADEQRKSPEQIEAEIDETREQLADTVEALAEKTDVKAQAKAKAQEAKETAQTKAEEAVDTAKQAAQAAPVRVREDRTVQYAIAGAVAVGIAIVLLKRRT
jgi:ElaB/YqjD/DUF883 family membrane-anchored ribosome-binding protein